MKKKIRNKIRKLLNVYYLDSVALDSIEWNSEESTKAKIHYRVYNKDNYGYFTKEELGLILKYYIDDKTERKEV